MSENDKELGYLGEDALLKAVPFATTRKAGYIEEEVDKWVKKALLAQENLVNEYNSLVYRCALAEGRVAELEAHLNGDLPVAAPAAETVVESNYSEEAPVAEDSANAEAFAELEARAAELEARNVELADHAAALESALEEAQTVNINHYAAPVVEAPVYEAPVAEEPVYEAPVEEPVYEAPVVEEPVVAAPVASVSVRAQQILDSAAREATEHVQRSLERVAEIEEEAQQEANELLESANSQATSLVENATLEAGELLENANLEADSIKTSAIEEAQAAVERREAALEDVSNLFNKVRSFHEYELSRVDEILGLTKTEDDEVEDEADVSDEVTEEASEELAPVEAELASDDSSDYYDYSAPAHASDEDPLEVSHEEDKSEEVASDEEADADVEAVTVEEFPETTETASEDYAAPVEDQTDEDSGTDDEIRY